MIKHNFIFKRIAVTLALVLGNFVSSAQVWGQNSFEFVNIASSARATGLGGLNVSLSNEDVNLARNNPALTSDTLAGYASFNFLSYFAGSNGISFVYQHDFEKYGSWFAGSNHIDYGDITGYDASGNGLGTFAAGETEIFLGTSHRIRHFRLGASLRFLNSNLGAYSANAVALDIGGLFQHPTKHFTAGLVFKNVGIVLSEYSESSKSNLPFDIQAGVTFNPEHMPFRFSFTGHHLYKGDISSSDPAQAGTEGNLVVFDKVFRHVIVGAELLLTKNVNLRFGYNHLVRQELRLKEYTGGAGLSYGLMFRVKAFEFAYSRGGYHVAGGAHNFTLTADTKLFIRKGKLL